MRTVKSTKFAISVDVSHVKLKLRWKLQSSLWNESNFCFPWVHVTNMPLTYRSHRKGSLLKNSVSTSFINMQAKGGLNLVPIAVTGFYYLTSPSNSKKNKKNKKKKEHTPASVIL